MSVFPLGCRVLNSWQMNVAWQPESCVSLATHKHYRQSVHSAHNHTHHFNSQFSRWTWVSRLPPWLAFSTYYSAVHLHPLGTPKLFISLRLNPIKSFLRWPPLSCSIYSPSSYNTSPNWHCLYIPHVQTTSIYLSGWPEWLGPVPTNLWSLEFLLHSFNIKKQTHI